MSNTAKCQLSRAIHDGTGMALPQGMSGDNPT